MELCHRCEKKWFHIGLNVDKISNGCQRVDQNLEEDMPFLYSDANEMDPVPVPDRLEPLTQIEEMLVAWVHRFIEVRQVRRVQYKYKGHVVRSAALKLRNRLGH